MAHVKISIVLDSGARIGPGKAALLESIQATGSISAAARGMGMTYKRAWSLLDSMNQAFIAPVATASAGGATGGGAGLTLFGIELLGRYRAIEARLREVAAVDTEAIRRMARPEAGPKV